MDAYLFDRIVKEADSDGFVDFGDVARDLLNTQSQYASYHVWGIADTPIFIDGLRFKYLDTFNYHQIRIHKDDVEVFVNRVTDYRNMYK